jgi:TPR repeat protein
MCGICAITSQYCHVNKAIGREYLRLAADQGYALAQYVYGTCLVQQAEEWRNKTNGQGDGGQGDYDNDQLCKQGCYYLEMSANQGNSMAQHNYGVCLLNGCGIDKDVEEAARYMKLSADQGDADGQCAYGICLFKGLGVKQDKMLALSCFEKAAKQGNLTAQCNYGISIFQSDVKVDISDDKTSTTGNLKNEEKSNVSNSDVKVDISKDETSTTLNLKNEEKSNVNNFRKDLSLFTESKWHSSFVEDSTISSNPTSQMNRSSGPTKDTSECDIQSPAFLYNVQNRRRAN